MRDPIGEILAYNQPLLEHRVPRDRTGEDLTREALKRKLEALASSPFRFFRGTFHLMARDMLQERFPRASSISPSGLIVGDLHLENFGVYRGQSGKLSFDVNDFDDIGEGPLDLDLRRLCTSAFLLPGVSPALRTKAAREIASAWAEAVAKVGGRFPVSAWRMANARGVVRRLLREAARRSRADFMEDVAPGKGHRLLADPKKFARPAKPWVRVVQKAFADYQENLRQLKAPDPPRGWKVLDVAYEFKGIGSLGRLRFAVLVGKGDQRRLFEFKEARPSAMDAARGVRSSGDRGRVQTASIRRLQGDPWPRVASAQLGRVAGLGRERDSAEKRLTADLLARGDTRVEELQDYARQCGQVLARLHCRHNAPAIFQTAWNPVAAARLAVAFAEKYAAQVQADQSAFARRKAQVAKALGL